MELRMTLRDITRPFRRIAGKIRKKLQGKKGRLRLVIIIGGLLSIILVATLVTGAFRNPVTDHYIAPKEIAELDLPSPTQNDVEGSEITIPEVVSTPEVKETPIVNSSEAVDATATSEPNTPSPSPKATSAPASNTPISSQETTAQASPVASPPADSPTAAVTDKEPELNNNWLDNKIKEHESELDPDDVEDFKAIIAKLDQAHIEKLASGGFTEEEIALLIKHMRQNLTDNEYTRSKELFSRYNYLLEEI
jgi:hypothetical protein